MSKLDLGGRLLRSTSAATFSNFFRLTVTFLTQAVLRRLVAPDDWGFWHWAVDFLFLLLGQVRDLGLSAQVVRDPHRPYGLLLQVELLWGLVLMAIIFGAAPLLARASPDASPNSVPLVQALLLFFVFEGLAKVPTTFFEAEIRIERVLAPEIARNLCYAGLAIPLAYLGYGVWSLLVAHVTASALFAAMLWWRAWGEMPLTGGSWRTADERREIATILKKSLPLMFMALLLLAVESIDIQVMSLRFSEKIVGLYGGAFLLASLVLRLLEWPLRRSLYPTFVAVRDDPERFYETFRLSTLLIMAFHIPVAGLLLTNASTVLGLVWGPDYEEATPFLELLCLVPLMQPFVRCAEDLLLPRHKEHLLSTAAAVNLAAFLGFGFYLTGVLGPAGMAWAKLLPLGSLLVTWAVYRENPRGFRRLGRDLLVLYGIAVLFYGAAVWIGGDGDQAVLRLTLAIAAGALSFLTYVALYRKAFMTFFRTIGDAG